MLRKRGSLLDKVKFRVTNALRLDKGKESMLVKSGLSCNCQLKRRKVAGKLTLG